MKATATTNEPKPAYRPITLTIVLETVEDAKEMWSVLDIGGVAIVPGPSWTKN